MEVFDPEEPKRRYCPCRNPQTVGREGKTRERLLERTRAKLDKIAGSKRRASAKTLGACVGRVLERSKMGKFVRWDLIDGRLSWSFDQDKIVAEKLFDGCYIVSGEVPKEKMAAIEVVASKKLSLVEEPSAASRLCNSKYGPSTTRPMIESEVTFSSARWPTTCSGISSSGLSLYSPPTAPTKIDNGQCAT